MKPEDVRAAVWALIGRHLPLHRWRDTIHVSAEAVPFVPDDLRLASRIDLHLSGLEMRLERHR